MKIYEKSLNVIFPPRLKKGDGLRIIAPSRSLSLVSEDNIHIAVKALEAEGFNVSFSRNCREKDMFISSSIKSRVDDLHKAFKDKNVNAILTAIGGFNSNQLLKYINYDIIKNNPKIICGYSDITALANAIFAKTGVITYIGPHFSTWGMKKEFEYNKEYFYKCVMKNKEFLIEPSKTWSDDAWYKDQNNRVLEKNEGYLVIHEGKAEGQIVGGNLGTFALLFGTEFMPDLSGKIVFVEDDAATDGSDDVTFDRELQSLVSQPNFNKVKGLIIGRFQKKSKMTPEKLKYIISTKEELKNIPVIAEADFGHTNPLFTFPIGGTAEIKAKENASIKIIKH
jgi:muramoyltetrapeptide carboxypeptidase LdcA involved in peptidoglycan recycling